jgi:AcrR family transcriptional regulator
VPRRRSRRASEPPLPGVGERILNTATELFYKEGIRAVGIQRVIDEAGIAKASLYAHYASKDELVAACLSQRGERARARVDAALRDPALDARGKLLKLFDLQIEWTSSAGFRGCPFLNASGELADDAHPARQVTGRQREWLHGLVGSLVRESGVRHAETVAAAIIVLYDGAAASALIDADPAAARHARWAVAQLLDANTPPAKMRKA